MLRTIYSNRHIQAHTKSHSANKKIYVCSSYHNKRCHACKQILLEKSTFLIYTVHVHVDEHLKCRLNLPLHAISFVMVLALHKLQYYPVKAMLSINNHRQNQTFINYYIVHKICMCTTLRISIPNANYMYQDMNIANLSQQAKTPFYSRSTPSDSR